ncbi:MAG: UDP-N-acetylmuramoyl-L-alanine--D-glutamate ligase, partial [Deltaproteobacteria bacterium]|nr:UDP-N-acetylmuramoyl-L-alanine--D-glutamate ligase [Deltaproteobacteria bacterium]
MTPYHPPDIRTVLSGLQTPVGLLGLGEEGRATLKFLWGHGVRDLRVFDLNGPGWGGDEPWREIPFFTGGDYLNRLPECRTVVRSPGIRPDLPRLLEAVSTGARLTSATELFLTLCPAPVAGVTGTVGKGTAASLMEAGLKSLGARVWLGGNIGVNPLGFLDAAAPGDSVAPGDVVVLELSSFQLMGLTGRRPEVAVVLRTTEEHLNWHPDVAEYRRAKGGLLAGGTGGQRVVYCADSPGSLEVAGEQARKGLAYSISGPVENGIGVDPGGHLARYTPAIPPVVLSGLERVALPGRFNLENIAAAYLGVESLAALTLEPAGKPGGGAGFTQAARETLERALAAFEGLPHRLERVAAVSSGGGAEVVFFNDSYATRPEAAQGAVESFAGPLAVIVGGSEKNADFGPLMEALCRHPGLARVVAMGQTSRRMVDQLEQTAR